MPHSTIPDEPRVGKRVRRKPQRWEGDRDVAGSSVAHGSTHGTHAVAGPGTTSQPESHTTATLPSQDSRVDTPVIDDGIANLERAVESARLQPCARDAVDFLHSWQLRAVSQQAAQLKALHVMLKRRLRKRTTRSPEHDRLEEDALRNARRVKQRTERGKAEEEKYIASNIHTMRPPVKGENLTEKEDRLNNNVLVPDEVRLPLEAYLPRRVRPRFIRLRSDVLRDNICPPPQHDGLEVQLSTDGKTEWHVLPTVAASAEWNTRKSNMRPKSTNSRGGPAADQGEHE